MPMKDISVKGRFKLSDVLPYFKDLYSSIGEVVDCTMKNRTIYLAIRNTSTTEVYAAIITFTLGTSGNNLKYTAYLEGSLVDRYDCPLKIIKQLTPTADQSVNEWRQKVRSYHSSLAKYRKVDLSKPFRVTGGIKFRNGNNAEYFVKVRRHFLAYYSENNELKSFKCKIVPSRYFELITQVNDGEILNQLNVNK